MLESIWYRNPRESLANRRLAETADKEVWNGSTLVGPHRDDLVFGLDGRDMSGFASRGQQRTAILAFKLAELDLFDRAQPSAVLEICRAQSRSIADAAGLVDHLLRLLFGLLR